MPSRRRALLKVIILGDSGSLATNTKATIGADFLTKEVQFEDRLFTFRYGILLAKKRFQSLGVAFTEVLIICVLVYDVNVMKSFDNLNNWRKEFLIQGSPAVSGFPSESMNQGTSRKASLYSSRHLQLLGLGSKSLRERTVFTILAPMVWVKTIDISSGTRPQLKVCDERILVFRLEIIDVLTPKLDVLAEPLTISHCQILENAGNLIAFYVAIAVSVSNIVYL
ncbi:hypothetical protein DH2020_023808 [Rehmannia glutinosa]|uniref:Uncharacterized protein n=1 Tax=Rehmannia glutinosa TaxID=99300 RepID=A0ABR0WBF7_REHGL